MTQNWGNNIALEYLNELDDLSCENDTPVHHLNIIESKAQQVDPAKFMRARSKSTRPQFLTLYVEEQLSNFELYLIGEDVGYALTPKKELVNLFNNSSVPGAGAEAVIDAISKGAKTLDCFSGHLDNYYRQFGFTETRREKWNDKFAPGNWNFIRDGRPDIVHMEYKGDQDVTKLRHQVIDVRERRTVMSMASPKL